jgi:hypothetical protein
VCPAIYVEITHHDHLALLRILTPDVVDELPDLSDLAHPRGGVLGIGAVGGVVGLRMGSDDMDVGRRADVHFRIERLLRRPTIYLYS